MKQAKARYRGRHTGRFSVLDLSVWPSDGRDSASSAFYFYIIEIEPEDTPAIFFQ